MKRVAGLLGVFGVAAAVSLSGCGEREGLVEGVDLKLVDLRIPSMTSLSQGMSVDLTVLVKNNGTERITDSFMTEVEFFDDAALRDESSWATAEVPYTRGLAPGEIVTLVISTTVYADNPPQLVFCEVTCDSRRVIDEVDERNNGYATACQVLPGTGGGGEPGEPVEGPDLVISSMTVPDQAIRGRTIDIAVTVRNDGDETVSEADAITVNVTIYDSQSYVEDNELWPPQEDSKAVVLGPAGTTSFDFSFPVDLADRLGPAYLVATVSCAADANAGNNEDTGSFTIINPPKPDLVVSSVVSSDPYKSGTSGGLVVTFEITNEGQAEANGSIAYVLISKDTEGIEQAVRLSDGENPVEEPVEGLAAGATSGDHTVSCTYDAPTQDNYKVYVKADGLGTVPESDEGNNVHFDITLIY